MIERLTARAHIEVQLPPQAERNRSEKVKKNPPKNHCNVQMPTPQTSTASLPVVGQRTTLNHKSDRKLHPSLPHLPEPDWYP